MSYFLKRICHVKSVITKFSHIELPLSKTYFVLFWRNVKDEII